MCVWRKSEYIDKSAQQPDERARKRAKATCRYVCLSHMPQLFDIVANFSPILIITDKREKSVWCIVGADLSQLNQYSELYFFVIFGVSEETILIKTGALKLTMWVRFWQFHPIHPIAVNTRIHACLARFAVIVDDTIYNPLHSFEILQLHMPLIFCREVEGWKGKRLNRGVRGNYSLDIVTIIII